MFDEPLFDTRDVLLRECEEFQQLCERHQELDARLGDLMARRHLSGSQRNEESALAGKKRAIKDRMAVMLRSH